MTRPQLVSTNLEAIVALQMTRTPPLIIAGLDPAIVTIMRNDRAIPPDNSTISSRIDMVGAI